MKKILLLLIIMLFVGCKVKKLTVEKSIEKEKESMSRHFDSLFKQSLNYQLNLQKSQFSLKSDFQLTSNQELDSNGVKKPLHYKHYVDGVLKEEIWLEGGELNKHAETSESKDLQTTEKSTNEKTLIDVDVGQEKEKEKASIKKQKKVNVFGFQFGFYLWLLLLIIVIILLRWLSKRFNLFDKFKPILNKIGVQKKSSNN